MDNPSNTDLQHQIEKIDQKVENRHRAVMRTIATAKNDLVKMINPVVKYVDDQKAVEQYLKDHPDPDPIRSNGSFNWGRVIELLVQALVAAITIIGVLLGTGKLNG